MTAKQIEEEFRHTDVSKVWRWSARKLADNKYSMRFPDARMVQVYSHFKCLGMKVAKAQIKVETWNSAASAKRELQPAWFRVKGIPSDQRSIKTIAKVGGLVGKTMDIDEKTRNRSNYVRVKIACRDVTQVPPSAESSLGLMIYDFFFEREVLEEPNKDKNKIGVQTDSATEQPVNKKLKTEEYKQMKNNEPSKGIEKNTPAREENYKKYDWGQSSAPAKLEWELRTSRNQKEEEGKGEVSWTESEETDNFSLGINGDDGITGQEDDSPGNYSDTRLVQCSEIHSTRNALDLIAGKLLKNAPPRLTLSERDEEPSLTLGMGSQNIISELENEEEVGDKSEVFKIKSGNEHEPDRLMRRHSNTEMGEEVLKTTVGELTNVLTKEEVEKYDAQASKDVQVPRVERRTSSRLRKEMALTTEDKITRMGKKRNLEGTNLNLENSFSVLEDNEIMQLSRNMGIEIDDSNFAAIDFMKELEIARHSLAKKKIAPIEVVIVEDPILEILEEETSDVDTLSHCSPKRKGKPKNRLSLSGPQRNKRSKENPCSKKSKGGSQGNPDPPMDDKCKKAVKKNERPNVEL